MADNYSSMTDLMSKVNSDLWEIQLKRTDSNIISLAPHGGGIEVGTTELAKRISELGDYCFFSFLGKKSSGNSELHVTSTHYDEPSILNLIKDTDYSISVHGASGTDPKVYMGGGNNALRNLIWDKLESIGIVCEVPGNNIAGVEPKNIANRTRTGGGVQLELTTALRSSLFADNNSGRANREDRSKWSSLMEKMARAIVQAVEEYRKQDNILNPQENVYSLVDSLKYKKSDLKQENIEKVKNNPLQTNTVGATIQLESNVTIPTNKYMTVPWSKVVYNNSEFWDTDNPTRIIVPDNVTKVRVSANVLWNSNATGQRMLRILKNGTYSLGLPYTRDTAISTSPMNGVSGIVPVTPGDYFEIEVFQDSGGDLLFRSDPYTWISIEALELEHETMEKDFMLIGHRGAPGYTEEHTIKGYELSLFKGADYIELDLQLTSDNKLLCMHDSTLDRTTTGTGTINSMTLQEIQSKYTTKNGEHIPSLYDVIEHFGKSVKYYIETKRPFDKQMDKELTNTLKEYGLIGIGSNEFQVIIQSFAPESLQNIHNNFTNIPLSYLTSTFNESEMDSCLDYNAYAIAPKYTTITKDLVDLAHSKGLKVHAWTVNTKTDIDNLIDMGVDGIFTNYLDEYK